MERQGAGERIATLAAFNRFVDWSDVAAEERESFTGFIIAAFQTIRDMYPDMNALDAWIEKLVEQKPFAEAVNMRALLMTAAVLVAMEDRPGAVPVEKVERLRSTLEEKVLQPARQQVWQYAPFAGQA